MKFKIPIMVVILICILLLIAFQLNKPSEEPVEETVVTTEPIVPLNIDAGTHSDIFVDTEFSRDLEYFLYVPENATEDMPLLIYLHGIGSVGSMKLLEENPAIINTQEIYGTSFPYIILAPNARIESWIGDSLPQRLKNLIDHIVDAYSIDSEHIMISGHSMGSTGVLQMVSLYGSYFSAAVPISEPNISQFDPSDLLDVPMWTFAGSEEPECNTAMQQFAESFQMLGGDIRHTELKDYKHGKTSYGAFTEELLNWMITQ